MIKKTFSQIMEEMWEEGSLENRQKLNKYKTLIQAYTYNCMEKVNENEN